MRKFLTYTQHYFIILSSHHTELKFYKGFIYLFCCKNNPLICFYFRHCPYQRTYFKNFKLFNTFENLSVLSVKNIYMNAMINIYSVVNRPLEIWFPPSLYPPSTTLKIFKAFFFFLLSALFPVFSSKNKLPILGTSRPFTAHTF